MTKERRDDGRCEERRRMRALGAFIGACSALALVAGCPDAIPNFGGSTGAGATSGTGATGASTGGPSGSTGAGASTGSSTSGSGSASSSGGGCSSATCPGACVLGRCLETVYDGGAALEGLAVDSERIYFADQSDGGVGACPIAGCGNNPPTYYGRAPAWDVAVDATNVYWRDATGVYSNAIATPGATPTQLAAGSFLGHLVGAIPTGIAVDATNVYWLADDGSGSLAVLSCAKAGCGGNPTTLCSPGGGHATLAIDAQHVYFGDYDTGEMWQCPIDGGAFKSLPAGIQFIGIALQGPNLYWGNQDGTLQTCPTASCTTDATVTAGNNFIGPLAVDDQAAYFVDYPSHAGTGNLKKCALAGCDGGATMLAPNEYIEALVVDATSAYFDVGGRLFKVTPK
jgi:hypothetical protein